MRSQSEIEALKEELDDLSDKAINLSVANPKAYEQISGWHSFQIQVVDALIWVLEQENVTTEVFRSPEMLGVDEMWKIVKSN